MKKHLAMLLAILLLVAACSSDDGGSEDTTTTAGEMEDVTLTVSTWTAEAPGLKDWWPTVIDSFEAEHPNVTVDLQQIAFSDYISGLTTRFVAGEGPDVIHVPLPLTTLPAWAEAGFLQDLDDFLATTDIPETWPSSQASMEWDGETYGVLLVDYGYVLFYNEAMLADAGVDVPTTSDELVAAAAALTTGDQYGYAVTADNTINFLRDAFQFIQGEGAQWIDGDSWTFDNPDVVAAVDNWRTIATQYAPQGTDIGQKRQSFYDGNVAMMIEGPFILAQIPANAPEDVAGDLHIAQMPFSEKSGDVSHGMSIFTGIPDNKQATAEEFIQHAAALASMESYVEHVASPVARREANSLLAEAGPDGEQIALAADSVSVLLFPADATGLRENFADFQSIAAEWFQQMLVSDIATADALANLQSDLEDAGITPN